MNDKEQNVIIFPKTAKKHAIQSVEELKNMVRTNRVEHADNVTEFVSETILSYIASSGFDVSRESFDDDFEFAIETIRSCLYRVFKEPHPIQDIVDDDDLISLIFDDNYNPDNFDVYDEDPQEDASQ